MNKRIHITSLGMRFYVNDGWSLELLRTYLSKSLPSEESFAQMGDFGGPYYILKPGGAIDSSRLIREGHVGELVGRNRWGELKGLSDLEILNDRGW